MRNRCGSAVSAALLVIGCSYQTPLVESREALTREALCANPGAYEGKELWLDARLEPSAVTLFTSSVAACSETDPCCNSGLYAYVLLCNEGEDIVIVPDGAETEYRPDPLLCAAQTRGEHPAECPLSCDTPDVLAVRRLRGTLGAARTSPPWDDALGSHRRFVVVETIRDPLPDVGPVIDAGL